MAISPVSASNATITATQAVKPPPPESVQKANKNEGNGDKVVAPQTPPPKPTVNANGQTVGTIVNVTA